MKTVYTCFCTDVIHEGHLNIIKNAQNYGQVIVGALSDEALIKYNKFPTISLEERVKLYESLEGVSRVIIQHDVMYDDIFTTLKPDYIVHGDNWEEGVEASIKQHVYLQSVDKKNRQTVESKISYAGISTKKTAPTVEDQTYREGA